MRTADETLVDVERWAESGARFPEDFEREFGFPAGEKSLGRQDAYRAVLRIIRRSRPVAVSVAVDDVAADEDRA